MVVLLVAKGWPYLDYAPYLTFPCFALPSFEGVDYSSSGRKFRSRNAYGIVNEKTMFVEAPANFAQIIDSIFLFWWAHKDSNLGRG
jgi:hypothetical protein